MAEHDGGRPRHHLFPDLTGSLHDRAVLDSPVDPDVEARGGAVTPRGRGLRLIGAIAAAGSLGTLARYGISEALPTHPHAWPWGTFLVNVVGSLLIGVAVEVIAARFREAPFFRPVVVTGFLGGFTTFSTYVVEADELWRSGNVLTGIGYSVVSILCGVAAVVAGLAIGRGMVSSVPAAADELEGAA